MKKEKKKIIIYLFSAIALTLIAFLLDGIVMKFSGPIRNSFLDIIFEWITNFGSVFVVLIVMTSLFLWEEKKREWIPTLWGSYITAIILVFVIKLIVARERITVTEFYPIIPILNHSFPSMHTAAAFAAIPILDREYPRLKKVWIAFAILVAITRIYFGEHFLSDVIAGGFLGYGIGASFVYLEEKKKIFKKVLRLIGYDRK